MSGAPITIDTLFIGGSHDGQWYPMDRDTDTVRVGRRCEHVRAGSIIDALLGTAAGPDEVYQRCVLEGEKRVFSFFTISHMEFDEAVAWLIGGYGVAETADSMPKQDGGAGAVGEGSEGGEEV